jgi:hypothetical protein
MCLLRRSRPDDEGAYLVRLDGSLFKPAVNHIESASVFVHDPVSGLVKDIPTTAKYKAGAVHQRTVRRVCKPCNEGWMGTVVQRAKPFANSMILDESVELDSIAQDYLSAWIAISSMMGEYTLRETMAIEAEDRSALFKTHLPPQGNWVICIGRYKNRQPDQILRRRLHGNLKVESPDAGYNVQSEAINFQLNTYALRALLIHVFSCHKALSRSFDPLRVPNGMVRIWPRINTRIQWPCSYVFDDPRLKRLSVDYGNWFGLKTPL